MLLSTRSFGRKRWLFASALALLLGSTFGIFAQEKQKKEKSPTPEKQVMIDKLKNAQTLLEGMALGDFAKIQKCAENLMNLSKKAEWFIVKTEKYQTFSNEFRRSLETLQAKAKDKNIDGATLVYVELTMTCMKCHKYCRDERETSLPLRDLGIGTLGE